MGDILRTIGNALKQLLQIIGQLLGRLGKWWVEKFRASKLRGKLVLVIVPLIGFCCMSTFLLPAPESDSVGEEDVTAVANVEDAEIEEAEIEAEPTDTSEPTAVPPTSTPEDTATPETYRHP